MHLAEYLPSQVNTGRFAVAYTLNELESRLPHDKVVLPICSLGTSVATLSKLAPLVLPPLYHEALNESLKVEIVDRVRQCFPFYSTRRRESYRGQFEIVELPRAEFTSRSCPRVLGFSVDTAVEEHGPHLPLGTDTIQSYAVLERLAAGIDGFVLGPPVEYGQLTWGLPFGCSIDITAPLLTRYVHGFVNAICRLYAPEAIYVVDVHGSIIHRQAIQDGLALSEHDRWCFRWLHEPLIEFAGDRGDQHAGGVETSLVHYINKALVDQRWWPARIDDIVDGQMSLDNAMKLSSDLPAFIQRVESGSLNGIVGDIRNFHRVDAELMMSRMLRTARQDVDSLLADIPA